MKFILYFLNPIVYSFCKINSNGFDIRPNIKEFNDTHLMIKQYQQKTLLDNLTNNHLSSFHKLRLIDEYEQCYPYSFWKGLELYDF